MVAFTIALGAALSVAMLNTMLGVGDKINMELKSYGANINVLPKDASLLDDIYGLSSDDAKLHKYLKEEDLPLIKTIFWGFNIVDFTPYFNTECAVKDMKRAPSAGMIEGSAADLGNVKVVGTWFNHHLSIPTGEEVDTGMQRLKNWWTVDGEWTADDDDNGCMIGILYSMRNDLNVGDEILITGSGEEKVFTITGIFNSGSQDDEVIYMPIDSAQRLAGIDNAVSRIEVSALTTPDNELARRAAKNPLSLTLKEKEVWYCTAYVSAICYQLQEVIADSVAKPIRQVSESEGDILNKTTLLMVLITTSK